jgi:hypothetical protein
MTIGVPYYESAAEFACRSRRRSGMVEIKKTSQGYARKRTLKPGGSFFYGGGSR